MNQLDRLDQPDQPRQPDQPDRLSTLPPFLQPKPKRPRIKFEHLPTYPNYNPLNDPAPYKILKITRTDKKLIVYTNEERRVPCPDSPVGYKVKKPRYKLPCYAAFPGRPTLEAEVINYAQYLKISLEEGRRVVNLLTGLYLLRKKIEREHKAQAAKAGTNSVNNPAINAGSSGQAPAKPPPKRHRQPWPYTVDALSPCAQHWYWQEQYELKRKAQGG